MWYRARRNCDRYARKYARRTNAAAVTHGTTVFLTAHRSRDHLAVPQRANNARHAAIPLYYHLATRHVGRRDSDEAYSARNVTVIHNDMKYERHRALELTANG